MHGLAVYVKEGLPFAWDLSLENSADSYLCFRLALLHSVSYFFFLYRSPSLALCTVFDSVSSNIHEVLSINPYAVFVFGDFNVRHKDWLLILVELIDMVKFVITFLSQMTLLRWLTFLLGSQTVILMVLLFWIYLFLLMLVFVLQWLFPPLGNSDHVVVSVSIDFPTNSQQDAPFHRIAYDYSCADWDGLRDHLRDVPWEDIFKLGASAATSEFCEWIQVGIDVYHIENIRSSLIHLYGFQLLVLLP